MALSYIPKQQEYVALSTDDKSIIKTDGSVVYYVDTKKREILNEGVWYDYIININEERLEEGKQISKSSTNLVNVKADVGGTLIVPANPNRISIEIQNVGLNTVALAFEGETPVFSGNCSKKIIGASSVGEADGGEYVDPPTIYVFKGAIRGITEIDDSDVLIIEKIKEDI